MRVECAGKYGAKFWACLRCAWKRESELEAEQEENAGRAMGRFELDPHWRKIQSGP